METLVTAEQPNRIEAEHEQLRSFDLTASVKRLRHDYEHFAEVQPLTREQVCDEELSYIVEGLGRASRTSFTMQRLGGELVYFSEGRWTPYSLMLKNGRTAAYLEAQRDPRRHFLAEAAEQDLDLGSQMRHLQPGEQLIWASPYPLEIEALYGPEFLRECGFQPDRKMGFVYRAYCNEDHSVTLESQTIDLSDPDALAAIAEARRYDPDMDLDVAVRVYDGALAKKYGGRFYAGRRSEAIRENAWEFLLQQRDLIEFHMTRLDELARGGLTGSALEHAVKKQIYGTWWAIKKRLNGEAPPPYNPIENATPAEVAYWRVYHEVQAAFTEAVVAGFSMPGCGGAISFEQAMDADPQAVFDGIFGDKSSEQSYSFDKKMYCVSCQAPPSKKDEPKKMCGPCGLCRACDRKFGGKG